MTVFVQQVRDCPEHEDCTAIVGVQDDIEVWVSHLHSDIHAEHRINQDHPAVDPSGKAVTWAAVCQDCATHPDWPASGVTS